MAANTTPYFIATDFGAVAAFSTVSTSLSAATNATVIATGSTNGGLFAGAVVHVISGSAAPTSFNFWWIDNSAGTTIYIGRLQWFTEINPASDSGTFIGKFVPDGGPFTIANADTIKAAPYSGSATYTVRALGGNY